MQIGNLSNRSPNRSQPPSPGLQPAQQQGQQYYQNQLAPQGEKKPYLKDGKKEFQVGEDGTPQGRKVSIFTQYPDYISNGIKTSKYSPLPMFAIENMWFQMHKLANIYFVIIALLQCIPQISISNGQPVILLPLLVVIAVSMLKDYYEDLKRKRADDLENNREVQIIENSSLEKKKIQCRELKVGHVLWGLINSQFEQLQKDQIIPADLLVLEIADKKKECFIETKNLDGETNLKIKEIPESLRIDKKIWTSNEVNASLEYINPSKHLELFHGTLFYEVNGQRQGTDFVESNNLLLRGCTLRTTEWVKGLVVYTGVDTKIQLNSCESSPKLSSLEVLMNKFIVVIFLIQVIICLSSGLYGAAWLHSHKASMKYLRFGKEKAASLAFFESLQIAGTWILIFTNFIPISLIVTLEMVKYIQGSRLEKDPFYVETKVQSSNLNEELGQVRYVFSDKTGTLTQNSMKFRCMSVQGQSYGQINQSEDQLKTQPNYLSMHLQNSCVNFYDPSFNEKMNNQNQRQPFVDAIKHMALCHNVVPQGPSGYSGPSPDEICLVGFAQSLGIQFLNKDDDNFLSLQIRLPGQSQTIEKYRLLHTFDFNSDRKRMSVIVQTPKGNILILTKGADNVMEKRLAGQKKYDDRTQDSLNVYSQFGFRTLVLTQREVPPNELAQFEKELSAARMLQKGRDETIDQLQDRMEQNQTLLVVTGVEDELQVDVADTIQKIKDAGTYFWVLTGDKEETAISIGYSTKVIGDDSNTRIIQLSKLVKQVIQGKNLVLGSSSNQSDTDPKVVLEKAISQATDMKNEYKQKSYIDAGIKIALVIKGDDLITISSDATLEKQFILMAIECDTVIASRVSPGQKQLIVEMVRKQLPKVTTLAIGDGANDVSMINAAHVGIGIRGKEGTQAERAANYAIPEFRYLSRLMFDFGRECYRRNSELVLYNFYKNMLLVLPQWWFGMLNGFSGVALYDPWLYQLYNTCFTALPIVVFAIEDREHSVQQLMKFPEKYYKQGLSNRLFNYSVFLITFFKGALDAGLIMMISFYSLENLSTARAPGSLFYLNMTGMVSYGISILISNLRILSFSHSVSVFQAICVGGSYLFYLFCYSLYDKLVQATDVRNTFGIQYSCKAFYLVNLISVALIYLVDIGLYVYQSNNYVYEQELASPKFIGNNSTVIARDLLSGAEPIGKSQGPQGGSQSNSQGYMKLH